MMNSCSSCYDLLGISPGSDIQKVRKAFRAKAKKYHPDVNHDAFAQANFIKCREAFEMIIKQKQNRNGIAKPASSKYAQYYKRRSNIRYCSSPRSNYRKHNKNENFNFTESLQGKVIYCVVHFIFILIGLMIFIDPLIIVVQHQFDPLKPLFDSIFAAIGCMIFGITMIMMIGTSLIGFIRKTPAR